ncbi:non-ribosomal peptide synthetase [Streptomyces clavuligerus]|nr:non-ribosomal peptide synthetase [Streptomyces clavuligerus]MBY6302355.1 non-ribosomal peptide synthetase [Streptomyces clavuligerus]QCS05246.1 non-ribosomal peptide synthetase [Streptomyces clavuligerus]QPJ96844.1 non-ribosomal peptide synthetase [Streptomyces clavuligerus]QPL66462.1 non-ribosomal peptide synthetase [Streptomyces clavuligerus]
MPPAAPADSRATASAPLPVPRPSTSAGTESAAVSPQPVPVGPALDGAGAWAGAAQPQGPAAAVSAAPASASAPPAVAQPQAPSASALPAGAVAGPESTAVPLSSVPDGSAPVVPGDARAPGSGAAALSVPGAPASAAQAVPGAQAPASPQGPAPGAVAGSEGTAVASPPPQAEPGPRGSAPLSQYQQDVVTVALTYRDRAVAQPSGYLRLTGAHDVERMRAAIRRVALRHDAMRLRLVADGETWRQWVPDAYPDVEVVSFLDAADPRAACQEWIARTTGAVIPLDGPLAQATILVDDADSLIVYCRFHHVAADAWGINLMLREVCGHYESPLPGQGPAEPAPSCLDTVAADEAYRASADWAADRDALAATVSGLDPALFARTATVAGHRRLRRSVHVDAPTADRIRATGRSVFSVTAAALAACLRRVHRDGDIVLGIPLLNRRTPEELTTMSNVANILPLHIPVGEQDTLLDLADRVRSGVWDLTAHQRLPLSDLLAALRAESGRRTPALFDVTYSYITVPDNPFDRRSDVDLTVLSSGYSLDAVNVVVREHESDGSLDVDVFYADDVFDASFSLDAAMGHLVRLLDGGLRDPAAPLLALELLDAAETARVQGFERPHTAPLDETATLDRLFLEQAARTPDRTAVVACDTEGRRHRLTYEEFHGRVAALARRLREAGIRPEECVPVLLPRSVDFLVAVHAVHAAGGAYVPVDPGHPRERVRTLLTDCGARLAIRAPQADGLLDGLLDGLGIRALDPAAPGGATAPADPPPATTRPTDLAYVIYTSGSTGTPKGVMIEHRSVVNRLAWMQRQYPLRDDDVILHKTPTTFDVSVWELMWWAQTGARVAVAPSGAERDPRELAAAVARHGVTVLHFVPSMLGPFLDHLEQRPEAAEQIRTIRRVFASGEALPPALAERFRTVFAAAGNTGARLVNLYGPTEAAVDVSFHEIPADGPLDRVPIGRPIDNIALMVLDGSGRRCPVGVAGELNIAGVGVGRGYLGRPDLTDEVFVRDAALPERRRYRTGDLARWLADGSLDYLGRVDDQVKVRGNRVTLGEIENALTRCPGVAAAAVADERTGDGTRLLAFLVPGEPRDAAQATAPGTTPGTAPGTAPGTTPGSARTAALVDALAALLPPYMIPAEFVWLDRLPLTRSGKTDRRALLARERPGRAGEPEGAGTPAERELTEIWRSVLGTRAFGVHDDFFTVGGDSILALRLRTEAEKRGFRFDLDQFYARPTVAGLAARVESAAESMAESARSGGPAAPGTGRGPDPAVTAPFDLVPLIDRASLHGVEDAFPASQLQLGMVYHSLESAESPLYKDVFRYRLRMPWDEDAFRRAYRRMVRRQPALRSGFDVTGRSTPLQIVFPDMPDTSDVPDGPDTAHAGDAPDAPGAPDALEITAPEATGPGEPAAYAHRMHRAAYPLLDAAAQRVTPLYRMRVFVRPDGADLVFSFHHALLDGWSVAQLMSGLLRDYLAYADGRDPADDPAAGSVPLTYLLAEHARAERAARGDAQARRFWERVLDGSTATTVESQRAHVVRTAADGAPDGPSAADGRLRPLPAWLDRAVRDFARRGGLPVKSVLLAAHCLALGAMTATDDVTTGCVTHTRPERPGAEEVAGLFLNTVPVRLDSHGRTWREAVEHVARWERDAFPYRRLPVGTLIAERGGPVFDTAFNFVNYHGLNELLGDGRIALTDVEVLERTNFGLLTTALVDPRDGRLALRVSTGEDGLTPAQCAEFARLLTAVLAELVRGPDEAVDPAVLRHREVTELFAGTAMEHPAHTAVVGGGPDRAERWTYRELTDTADTVAQALLARGLPHGARVAVRMRRSVELLAVVLGVLRAGAAVVPLDPDYPDARIRAMLAVAEPWLTVAESGPGGPVPGTDGVCAPEELLGAPDGTTDGAGGAPPLPRPAPEDAAYVLFTSGSTGEPKGVVMPHRALTNLIDWQNRRATGGVGVTTLQFAPLSFDVFFQEVFSTLCGGGTLHLLTEGTRHDMAAVLKTIADGGVQRVFLPYVALQALAEVAEATGTYPPSLRVIASSGEQLRITPEIRALCAALPELVLENQYGPTETHVVLAHRLLGAPGDLPALPPVGTPVTGAVVTLLDARKRPVPQGTPGEIHVEGPCVALGYEKRPELTSERFDTGPTGQTRYRTGDIGIALADGDIVCLGRADGQVKVRGYRVECAEVELAVLDHAANRPGIGQVAVVPRSLGGSDAVLQAFLTGDPGQADTEALRTALRSALPSHMVPAQYRWIDAMPLTPSGKRDDAALRALAASGTSAADAVGGGRPGEPGDDLESDLAAVLAEFAGVDRLGPDRSFFDAGGTSIGAVRVSMTIARRWGVELPLPAFLAAPTARDLAAVVRSQDTRSVFDPVVPLRTEGDGEPLFLVHPIGGSVLCYHDLVRHLPPGRPVYGLQAAGAEPGHQPLRSMEALAAAYIEAIRRVRPSGPVHLAGWSFGGYVAVEMARRLGEDAVPTLTLLDTMALGEGPRRGFGEEELIVMFFRELLWYAVGETDSDDGLETAGRGPDELFDAVFRRTVRLGILPEDGSPRLLRRLYEVFRANYRATMEYRVAPIRRPLLVLRAADALPNAFEVAHRTLGSMVGSPDNGWGHWAPGAVETVTVPGNHLTMMADPQVAAVAARLGAALAAPRDGRTGGTGRTEEGR